MSKLTAQTDELRLMGDRRAAKGEFAVATLLREAADTIESLRDSLNEVADMWAEAQIKSEDYALENMLLKIDNDTRWHELFGTPERAARTLVDISERMNFDGIGGDYDTILGWLRGDA